MTTPPKPLLALNGAEETLQVVIGLAAPGGPRVLHAWSRAVPGRAMEFLAPAVDEGLRACGLGPRDLGGIACVRGPGGFTGLRLVLATALGLAKAAGVPMAGIDYLPLLASGPEFQGRLFVLTRSRKRQVYIQSFAADGAEPPRPLDEPRAVDVELAVGAVAEAPGPVRVLGSGVRCNAELFAGLPGSVVLPPSWDDPSPVALLGAALGAGYGPEPVSPLYLRPSDAEENLPGIAAGRGMSPEEARRRLAEAASSTVSS